MTSSRFVMATVLAITPSLPNAHDNADTLVAPSNLTAASAIHRLTQLGYTEVRIVGQGEDSFVVELARGGQHFALTIIRKPTGPGTMCVSTSPT